MEKQTFPIPSYIYDRYSFHEETDFEKAKSIIHSLHNRPSTTFLNNTLINSSELHDLFLTNKNCLLIYQNLKLRRYKTFSNCC